MDSLSHRDVLKDWEWECCAAIPQCLGICWSMGCIQGFGSELEFIALSSPFLSSVDTEVGEGHGVFYPFFPPKLKLKPAKSPP